MDIADGVRARCRESRGKRRDGTPRIHIRKSASNPRIVEERGIGNSAIGLERKGAVGIGKPLAFYNIGCGRRVSRK